MTNVATFTAGRMTAEQYEQERTMLRETYGDSKREAGVRYEQELAKLFARSGWTQKELAKKEGKNVRSIPRLLTFGRFLNLSPTSADSQKALENVTESKFRRYWENTANEGAVANPHGGFGYNERQRFLAIHRLLVENNELTLREKAHPIRKAIVEFFADGDWHAIETIAKKCETSVAHVSQAMTSMNAQSQVAANERKRVGKSFHYRIFKKERTVSTDELTTKLKPIIKGLQAEGRKSIVTMSPPTVAHLAHQLAQLLDEWMSDQTAGGATQERSGSKRARRTDDVSSDEE